MYCRGDSREEIVALIREAIDLHIEDLAAQEIPIPNPCLDSEFV